MIVIFILLLFILAIISIVALYRWIKNCAGIRSAKLFLLLPGACVIYGFINIGLSIYRQKQPPNFEEVPNSYLEQAFNPGKDVLKTVVKTPEFEFIYFGSAHGWDTDHLYFLKKKDKLFRLEPSVKIENGFKRFEIVGDSILLFYEQFENGVFGDFWMEKSGNTYKTVSDHPAVVTESSVFNYKNGRLKRFESRSIDIDSVYLKTLKNTLYRLESGKLVEVIEYQNLDKEIRGYKDLNLQDGLYYFSYPGRHITDTLAF